MSGPQMSDDGAEVSVAVYVRLLEAVLQDVPDALVRALVRPADPQARVALRRAADTGALRGRVEVVTDDRGVLGAGRDGSPVVGGGVLVALGPVVRDGARARVRCATYRSMADAGGGTYVLEQREGAWRVVDVEQAFRL